ncbi:MAG: DUF3187 family protein [Bdellovibrionales bacterium]
MERCLFLLLLLLFCFKVEASKPSFYVPHPIGWMHALPVGETPGWSGNLWFNLELSQANIWNDEFDLTNNRTGKTLTYAADYEQTSVVTDLGFALSERWSLGLVAPFASRGGGAMDDFIDQFHVFIGSERFLRNINHDFGRSYKVETNGTDQFTNHSWTAVGNLKLKTKYWLWQWRGSQNGSCDCGFSLGAQVKFPLNKARSGMSSGTNDYTLLAHLGAPLWHHSGIWATAAYTALGRNDLFSDWPMRRDAQMYELSMDLGFEHWGIILQGRLESPIMNKGDLTFNYTTIDPKSQVAYRVASGWNSLVYWRGSQSIGFRYRGNAGHQLNVLIVEDWALGKQDSRVDGLYVHNAPDVAFVMQLHMHF